MLGQDPWEYQWFDNRTNYQTKNNILSRRELTDCNWARTQNHLVGKRTLDHLAKLTKRVSNHLIKQTLNHLAKWLSVRLQTKCFWVRVQFSVTYTSDFAPASSKGVPRHSGNYRVWIHSETRTWHDKNIQSRGLMASFMEFL